MMLNVFYLIFKAFCQIPYAYKIGPFTDVLLKKCQNSCQVYGMARTSKFYLKAACLGY